MDGSATFAPREGPRNTDECEGYDIDRGGGLRAFVLVGIKDSRRPSVRDFDLVVDGVHLSLKLFIGYLGGKNKYEGTPNATVKPPKTAMPTVLLVTLPLDVCPFEAASPTVMKPDNAAGTSVDQAPTVVQTFLFS